MAIYTGTRIREGTTSEARVRVDGAPLQHVSVHSPTGFQWGYAGSGPADLALSILVHHFGETPDLVQKGEVYDPVKEAWVVSRAWAYHQDFKFALVAKWDDEWAVTTKQIKDWLATHLAPEDVSANTADEPTDTPRTFKVEIPYMNEDPRQPDVWHGTAEDGNLIKVLAEFAEVDEDNIDDIRGECGNWGARIILVQGANGKWTEHEIEDILEESKAAAE